MPRKIETDAKTTRRLYMRWYRTQQKKQERERIKLAKEMGLL